VEEEEKTRKGACCITYMARAPFKKKQASPCREQAVSQRKGGKKKEKKQKETYVIDWA